MASIWQHVKHGVLVSTGIAITGTTIYFADRDRVEAQDVAELVMAVAERVASISGDVGSVYSITNIYPVYASTGVEWYEYDDDAGTVTTNYYLIPTGGNVDDVHNVDGYIFLWSPYWFANPFNERVPTGERVIVAGWESLTLSGFPVNYDGVYYFSVLQPMQGVVPYEWGALYTNAVNTNALLLIRSDSIGLWDTGIDLFEPYESITPRTFNADDGKHVLRVDTWEDIWGVFTGVPVISNATVTASAEIIPHKLICRERYTLQPPRGIQQRMGVRITKSNTDYIDNNIIALNGLDWTDFGGGIDQFFVNTPTNGAPIPLSELFPPYEEVAFTNAIAPRLSKNAFKERYDTIFGLGSSTIARRSLEWDNGVIYVWQGESTNSVADAISAALSANPDETPFDGAPFRRGAVSATVSGFPQTTNWVARYDARIAQPRTSSLYAGLDKVIYMFTRVKPITGGSFHSSEGFDTNSFYSVTEGAPHSLGSATSYTSPYKWPFIYAVESSYFNEAGGTLGWQYGGGGFYQDNPPAAVIAIWDYEYAVDER